MLDDCRKLHRQSDRSDNISKSVYLICCLTYLSFFEDVQVSLIVNVLLLSLILLSERL